jgi:LmbE family N-acetylglucosaminyl deacetylase
VALLVMSDADRSTVWSQIERAPLLPARSVCAFGPTLVVGPHPDDEVLGCGGLIALLQQARIPVLVLIVSDGAASHPGSRRYPPAALAALRRAESIAGLALLGVAASQIVFLDLPDGGVPGVATPEGRHAVERIGEVLQTRRDIQTVFVPWRRDPHGDHRAAWSLATTAVAETTVAVRCLEYPIWTLFDPSPDVPPHPDEAQWWRLDIDPVRDLKRAAILAHQSQTTPLIDDATLPYCLPGSVLERFSQPWEPYIEVRP